jgi:hypothetical protein
MDVGDNKMNLMIEKLRRDMIDSMRDAERKSKNSGMKENINKYEMQALLNLKNNKNIIIKPADKNMGLAIMDKSWYDEKGDEFMNNDNNYKKHATFDCEIIKNKIEN